MATTGTVPQNGDEAPLNRADEVKELLDAVQQLIIPFIRSADEDAATEHTGHGLAVPGEGPRTALVEHHPPQKLQSLLNLKVPEKIEGGEGKERLLEVVKDVLKYSVNTWDQGFMDKLYASTNAVGVVSELLLAVLNTNAHVYQVSPVLTLIEKHITQYLASLFSFPLPHSGGISQPGGSASNSTAIVIARNTLYPLTKTQGNGSHKFTLFTSAHGHYSLEKAAQMFGLGSDNVISVPVDQNGRMLPSALDRLVTESKARGETPFFVNATAGTTVLGSFDPFALLSPICKTHNLWLHIDGSWGGPVIFSREHAATRLSGAHLADSIAITPHKMLGVPMTCSFLLGRDMRQFQRAMTLKAGYLFHTDTDSDLSSTTTTTTSSTAPPEVNVNSIFDLADLTPQCGRRSDALKFFLALSYYGTSHYTTLVSRGFASANYLLSLLTSSPHFLAISPDPVPCHQVCFYYAREGKLDSDVQRVSKCTAEIARALIGRGFMVDYAPGEKGSFFRVVVNGNTRRGTLEGLVEGIEEAATELGY
ncbi:glutamate decarboxylase-like protein 1 [Amniculicola lignicola CBS 123094]|uniref:Glutamate decarboxylase-like protein 1 n=1 Tax=Amniculicola lignicola CBS 123094 TaxID=1392246 RepID=A0A6A5WMV9_9PLEO|nr:glutamate decarboxylase-like protein 1 [Amniculicola lignicola CBS 123094]